MTYAFWIALLVVLVAVLPALLRRPRTHRKDGGDGGGMIAPHSDRRADSRDDGDGDGDGGGDGGGD